MVLDNCLIIIISSPSGVGKTTITKRLKRKINKSYLSISCTTRSPRKNERNKKDYFFVSKEKFLKYKKQKKFIETAKVHNNFYGTFKSELKKNYKKKQSCFFRYRLAGCKKYKKKN